MPSARKTQANEDFFRAVSKDCRTRSRFFRRGARIIRRSKWRTEKAMQGKWVAAILGPILGFVCASIGARELAGDADIDQAAISKISSLYGIHSSVVAHVDLTQPFSAKFRWTLVIAKQPDEVIQTLHGPYEKEGAVSVCFVRNTDADCSDAAFLEKYREHKIALEPGDRPFYELLASQVVFSRPGGKAPLLYLKTCTLHGGNGSCGISTFLFAYDRKSDAFRMAFFNFTGRNNNQATRFVESGPLLGDVIAAYPSDNAPFTYYVEVYKPNAAGDYARVLKYRGRTAYNDGDLLPVIDSEMPEILRRFGVWKKGEALPIPPAPFSSCAPLVMRKGVEWCESGSQLESRARND